MAFFLHIFDYLVHHQYLAYGCQFTDEFSQSIEYETDFRKNFFYQPLFIWSISGNFVGCHYFELGESRIAFQKIYRSGKLKLKQHIIWNTRAITIHHFFSICFFYTNNV